ncbi:MAG TPA: Ig-like domain-containing protein [Candidatus Angelobacter sp.]
MRNKKVAAVAAMLLVVMTVVVRAQSGSGIQYFYDDLGRLIKVVDQSGNVATYTYDAVGNILKISRSTIASPATLAVLNFTPSQGGVGATVTIQGQGFNPTPALNAVSFNGTAATVLSASASSIVTTVPAGASTGPITVTANGQTATSDANFIFIPSPAILSINPKFVVTSPSITQISNFSVTGVALNSATFAFQPATVPPTISITSIAADPSGTSATLSLSIAANAAGSFTLVATNGSGSSSQVPSAANTLRIISPDGDDDNDGLTNAVEIALGTDPFNASTAGDGISDGWKVFYGLDPIHPIATQDPDRDGLTNLQEFQAGTDPGNPDVTPPTVAQVSPADQSTGFPTNGRIVVRFTEPLLNGINLTAAQTAINRVAPSLPVTNQTTAGQVLQGYLQRTCCASSIVPGIVNLSQSGTPVNGSVQLSNDRLSVTFTPAQKLLATTPYSLQVNNVRDVAGNGMTTAFQSSFTTGTADDLTRPSVIQTSPASGATNVPTNVAFSLLFSKPIDPSTLTTQSVKLQDNTSGLFADGILQVDASGLTAAFVPSTNLSVGRTYSAILDGSSIRDIAGNLYAGQTFFSFTTAFAPDNDVPHIIGTSPANGQIGVPTNGVIVLEFNEPLNSISVLNSIKLTSDSGTVVAGSIALSDSNRRITFTPAVILAAATNYTVTVLPSIADLADRLIDNTGTFTFQTGAGTDVVRPSVATVNPTNGATGAPVNTALQVQFSERIDPLTVTTSTFEVAPNSSGIPIPGVVSVSADGQTAGFVPNQPLVSETAYQIIVTNGVTDLTGQALSFFVSNLTTGLATATAGPQVTAVSPANGAANVPVNAHVSVLLTSAVNPITVGNGAIAVSANGTPVSGTMTVSSDRRTLTFTPSALLSASTVYAVSAGGFSDVAGNLVTPFTSSFTTGTSAVADKTALTVQTVSPVNGATGVPANTSVVLTFNKPVDGTTVNQNTVFVQGAGIRVAGTYVVNGNQISFTPSTPLAGNTSWQVIVEQPLQDPAGNGVNTFVSSFTTGAAVDTTAPQVVAMTPNDGAANIGLNATAVLNFSKPLNPSTVNSSTFALFSGSTVLGTSVSISSDGQTVTLSSGQLPASRLITVAATSGVKDLAGNSLVEFNSRFTTAATFDTAHASVTNQRPGNGATGVPLSSSVVVYVNEALNSATVNGAFHVSQNGVLTQGTVKLSGSGQIVEFTPAAPWQSNALIQVFLDSTALDTDGSFVNAYQGSFRTAVDTTGVTPQPVASSPVSGATGVPENAVVELKYNEALNPNSVNANTVLLRQNFGNGGVVAGTITLDQTGTIIRFVPNAPLAANSQYFLQTTTGIQGVNGLAQTFFSNTFFIISATTDTAGPVVTLVSPPDGGQGVPVNADIHVRFNEPVNPLRVNAATVQVAGGGQTAVASSISFNSANTEAVLTPLEPFPDNTLMTITISGVQDLAGNVVIGKTTQFTTSAVAATTVPGVISTNPTSGAGNVALNAVIAVQFNAAVDPGTVNSATLRLIDNVTGLQVTGSYTTSADGLTAMLVPDASLAVSRSYSLFFTSGITDLAGNVVNCSVLCNFSFTTGTAADVTAPGVLGISPADQQTGVPTNAQVVIAFNEPIDSLTLGQVQLSNAGGPVNAVKSLTNGQRTLILTPAAPLNAATQYSISVAGVQDLSGNPLPAPVAASFTTGTGADLIRPTVVAVSPANGASGVPVNTALQVQFSERIDPLTVTTSTFEVVAPGGILLNGATSVSPDSLVATFTPQVPLLISTSYQIVVTNGVTDLTGLTINTFSSSFVTGASAISTIVGGGTPPTNVSATAGEIGRPRGIAADIAGNYYISSAAETRVFKVDPSGNLKIYAGNGTGSPVGDGGLATAAGLFMRGVAVDSSGNLFIADPDNLNVRRVDAVTGIITTVAGGGTSVPGDGGPATAAGLFTPNAVVLDKNGNLFIAEFGAHRIRRVDVATGIISTVAGTGVAGFTGDGGPATAAQLLGPQNVALDAVGNLFIADTNNQRVRRIDSSTGIITTIAGNGTTTFSGDGGPATAAGMHPLGLALDSASNLYIADPLNLRVRRVDAATGVISTFAGNGIFNSTGDGGPAISAALKTPEFLALDNKGGLLITEEFGDHIRRIDPATLIISTVAGNGLSFTGDGQAATSALLNFPQDVHFDPSGNILIADTNLSRIRRVNASSGLITMIAGNGLFLFTGDNGVATSASLDNPESASTDASGNIYISDFSNNRIRRIDALSGIITTVAGNGTAGTNGDGGPATAASLNGPGMTLVDGSGNLFIADLSNRIRRVDALNGVITTIAGNGVAGFSGDGGPAFAAQLNFNPGFSFFIDGSGNLLIADTGNNRIRRVDASTGIITTIAGTGISGSSGDGGSATNAQLSFPTGVAVDGFGNLFIADLGNNRIRRIDAATRTITTIAGTGVLGFGGDGGAPAAAKLAEPIAVAIDQSGALLILDLLNNRLRRVPAAGAAKPPAPGTFRGPSAPLASLIQQRLLNASIRFPDLLQRPATNLGTTHQLGILLPVLSLNWDFFKKEDFFASTKK